jgi:oligopeptide transport system ATP-binding protein
MMASSMESLIEINDLRTRFHTPEGTVYAVNGISYYLNKAETLAVVGESGCGKSVSMLSVLGLIPKPPGEISSGTAMFRGNDLSRSDDILEPGADYWKANY